MFRGKRKPVVSRALVTIISFLPPDRQVVTVLVVCFRERWGSRRIPAITRMFELFQIPTPLTHSATTASRFLQCRILNRILVAALVVCLISSGLVSAANAELHFRSQPSQGESLRASSAPSNHVFRADGEWPQPVRCGRHVKPGSEKDLDGVLPNLPTDHLWLRQHSGPGPGCPDVRHSSPSRNLPLVI